MIKGTIYINGEKHSVMTEKGMVALSLFREHKASVYAPCGGNGTCGKCRMIIRGELSEPDERERAFLSDEDLSRDIRLACMCRLMGDFEIIPMDENMRIQTSSRCVSYTPSSVLQTKRNEKETVFYKNGAEFCRGSSSVKNLGLAVDIGTTTVAAYLCDMDKGEILSVRGFKNPQSMYGADVISRMDKIMKDPSLNEVQQKAICGAIREAAYAMCMEKDMDALDIRAAVICGVGVFFLTLPCVFGGLSGLSIGKLSSVLDVEDYLVSNILLPLGALTFAVFCSWKLGWGFDNFMSEANTGKGMKVKKWMYGYMKYVLPVIIGVLFVMGAINPFI